MKKILVIQFRLSPERSALEQERYIRDVAGSAEIRFESALQTIPPWEEPVKMLEGVDGVILGGSGDFDLDGGRSENDAARITARELLERIRALVAYVFENNIPILGVCFGHQLIAEMRGGGVTHDHEQKKVGSFEVRLSDDAKQDSLLKDFPQTFFAQYGHKDSVTGLPRGATLLATGPACKFSILRYGSKVYTTQFHPELTADDTIFILSRFPGYLPEGVKAESIVQKSEDASQLIRKFVERIV